jgi:hypothetical protein
MGTRIYRLLVRLYALLAPAPRKGPGWVESRRRHELDSR